MSSHVLPPPVPELDNEGNRPKLWVIEEEQELDLGDVAEVGSSLTAEDIRTRYVDPTALDAATALCGVPTGASISRGSFSGVSLETDGDSSSKELYGASGTNLLRECNRVNTAQMVASVQFVRRRRMQNMILAGSAVASLAAVATIFVV